MFRSVPTRREIENSKTTVKKFKKLKNTNTGSFEAKIGRKRPGKIENKNSKKIVKKFKKFKKLHYGFI